MLKQSRADVKPSVVIWIKVSFFTSQRPVASAQKSLLKSAAAISANKQENEWRRETICSFSVAVPVVFFFLQKYPAGGLRV